MLIINNNCVEAYNEGQDIPKFLYDQDGVKAFHIRWHSSDAWRGYYEAKAVHGSGYKKIDYEGWVTGNWSDAPEEAQSDNVEAKLNELAREYAAKGYNVTAVFLFTSNVFSTAFDVFVKKV